MGGATDDKRKLQQEIKRSSSSSSSSSINSNSSSINSSMWTVAVLLICLAAWPAAAVRRLSLADSRVRPVLSSIMRCQNFSTLRVAVVQDGEAPQTLRLRLNADSSVSDISDDDGMLQIGSVSKGMFGTALPLIEQRLRRERRDQRFDLLTAPLKRLLGDSFWFLDHGRTEQVTLQDLVSHTAGLDRHDALWLMRAANSLEEVAKLSSRLSARLPFRASFMYNNLAFSVADMALRRLTNQTFAQYMRSELWQPLGMTGTKTAAELNYEDSNLFKSLELAEAAGGIVLPLDDMVKYLQYHVANYSYSNAGRVPKYFSAINSHPLDFSLPPLFSHSVMLDNVTNVPDWNIHSYGYGWAKSHYRDSLDYYHGGAYFSARTEVDFFVKHKTAVFTFGSLGDFEDSSLQSTYVIFVNKFISDLLLINDSFINEDNACSLMKPAPPPQTFVMPLRHLSDQEVATCTGRFSNFGFGTVTVTHDASSGDLSGQYGIGRLQLIPLQRQAAASVFEFLAILHHPREVSNSRVLTGRNSTHVSIAGRAEPHLLVITTTGSGDVTLSAQLLQAGLVMTKGLDVGSWRRPQLCPGAPSAAARVRVDLLLLPLLMLLPLLPLRAA